MTPSRFAPSRFSVRRLAAALLLAGALAAPPAQAGIFEPESFTLPNGMMVVAVPNHRVPVVTHMVWYKVGSADEPAGKTGLAHFLEHLMFKGTRTMQAGEFSREVARHGGTENAFTSRDYTGYHQTIAKDRLERVMRMEADRMTNLVLTAEEIETERLVILEERRQRVDSSPAALLGEAATAAAYMRHPFGQPVIGWEIDIRGLTADDIRAFYRRHYAPNNAILVVGGDITLAELKPLAERVYGAIPGTDVPPRIRPAEPPRRADVEVVRMDTRAGQPSWHRSFDAPGYRADGTPAPERYALEVLSEVLGGGATSRLYRGLVVERALASSAGSYYSPENLGPSSFGFFATPSAGVAPATVGEAVMAELKKVLAEGVTAEEVERAKTRMQAQAAYARDSLGRGARLIGAALASGLSIAEVEEWPERIAAVTPEAVAAAAQAVFKDAYSITSILIPKEGA